MLVDLEKLRGNSTPVAVAPQVLPPDPIDSTPTIQKECPTQKETTKGKKNKQTKLLASIATVIAIIIAILLLLHSCNGKHEDLDSTEGASSTEDNSSVTSTTGQTESGVTTAPIQLEWSEWMQALPEHVNSADYDIEERVLYSSRTLETTSSTETDSMEGWELYDTVEAGAGFGAWSDWSSSAVTGTETREVETQSVYRYRDKETTTSSNSSKAGWELYDTTYSWSDYGSWSSWSESSFSQSDSRKVETKTQYRYRDISYTTEYTDWGSWSAWSFDRQSTSDLKKEESRTVWGYYYYTCPGCGAHMHGWNMYCPTWAGGCGSAWISEGDWTQIYSTTSWDSAGLKDWHGTGKYYTYIDGQLVFKWTSGGSGTQYRYATRSTEQVANYSDWSSWGDTAYSNSSTREVQKRTMYRYCDRTQVPTYYFYRWGSWSGWSTNSVTATGSREVETAIQYRYRDQVVVTTNYFRRWTEWSGYNEQVAAPSETVEVQTQTQYRYKSKAS